MIVRVLAPIAILGFMSHRIIHADDWLSDAGFRVPLEIVDYRQPLPIPGLPVWAAWTVALAFLVSGLMTAAGAFTRWSASAFTALAIYVALADRLSAFTVSKLAPMIGLALALTPGGVVGSVDAWRAKRTKPPTRVSGGCVSFFQIFCRCSTSRRGSRRPRARGSTTATSCGRTSTTRTRRTSATGSAGVMPMWMWPVLQITVLVFELGAPLWFSLRWTRTPAMIYGLGMHLMIGLMFGPGDLVLDLMMSLSIASYAPMRWLERVPWLRRLGQSANV